MKKVFSNSDLAHMYAQQTQNEGRNSNGSFFFHGPTLFSYGHHFAICKYITNEQGQNALLFTQRGYSNTTAKQISLARHATSHQNKVYCHNPIGSHDENFKAWKTQAEETAAKLAKAKKPEMYLNALGHISHYATQYAEFFTLSIPETLQVLLDMKDKNEYLQYATKKAEETAKEAQRIMKENKKKFKESFKKWLSCEIPYLHTRLAFDFLRLNDGRVETTQGVKIPLELAKRLHTSIEKNTIKEGDRVLNFTINEVGAQIRIGCHTFTKSYLLKFGAQLK